MSLTLSGKISRFRPMTEPRKDQIQWGVGAASQVALVVKNPPARRRFEPWVGKIPWWRAWQPTPVQYSCLENPTDRGAW